MNKCIFCGIQLSDGLTFSADTSEHLNITIMLLRPFSDLLFLTGDTSNQIQMTEESSEN